MIDFSNIFLYNRFSSVFLWQKLLTGCQDAVMGVAHNEHRLRQSRQVFTNHIPRFRFFGYHSFLDDIFETEKKGTERKSNPSRP